MNIKERFKKFLDDQRLDREMKIARKKIEEKEKEKIQVVKVSKENLGGEFNKNKEENFEKEAKKETNKKFKLSLERLKDAGLVAVAVMLVGIRIY